MSAVIDRISADADVQNGQPCVRGTRLTVRRVLSLLKTYPDRDELYHEFPELDDEAVRQCLDYAAASVADRDVPAVGIPVPAGA